MKFFRNKYVIALKNVMLFSAIVHMIMIAIYSIVKLNTVKFNFFDILDLDLFFPNIIKGNLSQVFSIIAFVIVYCIFYFINKEKNK
ncbi:MAG: hypothetical protein DRH89_10655 [Candidatus Cloacimonadota bacterium]|nr:MAG: hypothetical protein DRH89_10655 [Candidatus Cloacimonadota bacterium]